jgi:Flp pilus assembly pilin Flp
MKPEAKKPLRQIAERREVMDFLTKMYVKASEGVRSYREGQTMTEYALILAAIAVVVFAAYNTLGSGINKMVSNLNTQLNQ